MGASPKRRKEEGGRGQGTGRPGPLIVRRAGTGRDLALHADAHECVNLHASCALPVGWLLGCVTWEGKWKMSSSLVKGFPGGLETFPRFRADDAQPGAGARK